MNNNRGNVPSSNGQNTESTTILRASALLSVTGEAMAEPASRMEQSVGQLESSVQTLQVGEAEARQRMLKAEAALANATVAMNCLAEQNSQLNERVLALSSQISDFALHIEMERLDALQKKNWFTPPFVSSAKNAQLAFALKLPGGDFSLTKWKMKGRSRLEYHGNLIQAFSPTASKTTFSTRHPKRPEDANPASCYPVLPLKDYKVTIFAIVASGVLKLRWMSYDATTRIQQETAILSTGINTLRVMTFPGASSFAFALDAEEDCRFRVISIKVERYDQDRLPETMTTTPVRQPVRTFPFRAGEEGAPTEPFKGCQDLRVATILDDFSLISFGPECLFLQLTPEHWETEIAPFKPDLLFVESAWLGKNRLWNRKVSIISPELLALCTWCKRHGVPTVFWNKEDPAHFRNFICTAALFDFVFTTDIDCIKRYKKVLLNENVHLMPFSAQPKMHNPLEIGDRLDAFCFAGAYYSVRYPERQRDLDLFATVTHSEKRLDIYDRNFHHSNPDIQFPARFKPLIVGHLPPEAIDRAYKGYRYAINMNSIKQSQSMFARRVFELLASNTIAVSNYSRGVRNLFGDLVICTDDEHFLRRKIREFSADEVYYRKMRLAGLRKVMAEHTSGERIAYLAEIVFGLARQTNPPVVNAVAFVGNDREMANVIRSFDAQRHPGKQLVVVLHDGYAPADISNSASVRWMPWAEAAVCKVADLEMEGYIAGWSPDDYYGVNYLFDLALATRYADSPVIGKAAFYQAGPTGEIRQEHDGCQYRRVAQVPLRSGICAVSMQGDRLLSDFAAAIDTEVFRQVDALAVDEFNYCRNFSGMSCPEVDDLPGLDPGVPVTALERVSSAVSMDDDECVGKGYSGGELIALFPEQCSGGITLRVCDDELEIESTLPEGEYRYIYAKRVLPVDTFGFRDRNAHIFLTAGAGLQIRFCFSFLDRSKHKLGFLVATPSRNNSKPIPEGTVAIRQALRVQGPGKTRIRRVYYGTISENAGCMVETGSVLVLSNLYPHYSDLYRYVFLHRRVLGYKKAGLRVDVLRFNSELPEGYFEFEGVDVASGHDSALRQVLEGDACRTVLVHFLNAEMWRLLKGALDRKRVIIWLHGAEVQPWWRREFAIASEEEKKRAVKASEKRMALWKEVFATESANLHFVFVSEFFAQEVMGDMGVRLAPERFSVIHNLIDTDLFAYVAKHPDQRKKILSIRPFASKVYANDLSVAAILRLSKEPFFSELEFRIVGDGVLFEETLAPLRGFPNVTLEKRFIRQDEIAVLHREYGVFLCPSRMDSQGVSRDEAMASGLVPVTNSVAAIPEFVDADCGMLAPRDDAGALADAIKELYRNPELFARLSGNAAARVRRQSSPRQTLEREIELIQETVE